MAKKALFNLDDDLVIAHREEVLGVVATLMKGGNSQKQACQLAGVAPATYVRWRDDYASKGREGLRPGKSTGRPEKVKVGEADALEIQRAVLKCNLGKNKSSHVGALRRLAKDGKLSAEVAAEILRDRSSKHNIPRSLRKVCKRVSEKLIQMHRSPRAARLSLAANTFTMRMDLHGNRLRAGMRQSHDDGSINFICCVPWPMGGCKCSDRWGVKVGRFQTLLGIDDATDFCPGFSFVARPRASYRGEDVVGHLGRVWMDDVRPDMVIVEQNVWASQRAERFYAETGVNIQHAFSPNGKLVENYWNRLWTQLSFVDGQIGRYRGEEEEMNKLLMACQQGSKDPRKIFPMLDKTIEEIEKAIIFLNSEPVESKGYGKWVPQERYFEQLEESPRRKLDPALRWMFASEQHTWKVARNGTVGGRVPCPLGPSIPYYFACEHLLDFAGAKVTCFFDPYLSPVRATVALAEDFRGHRAGSIISQKAEVIVEVPRLQRLAEAWEREDGGRTPLATALKYRQSYWQALRMEYRALGFGGRRKNAVSAMDDGISRRVEVGGTSLAIGAAENGPDGRNGRDGQRESIAAPARISGESLAAATRLPAPNEIPDDTAEIVARARARVEEAKKRGAIEQPY